jgi:hypothetical protein
LGDFLFEGLRTLQRPVLGLNTLSSCLHLAFCCATVIFLGDFLGDLRLERLDFLGDLRLIDFLLDLRLERLDFLGDFLFNCLRTLQRPVTGLNTLSSDLHLAFCCATVIFTDFLRERLAFRGDFLCDFLCTIFIIIQEKEKIFKKKSIKNISKIFLFFKMNRKYKGERMYDENMDIHNYLFLFIRIHRKVLI